MINKYMYHNLARLIYFYKFQCVSIDNNFFSLFFPLWFLLSCSGELMSENCSFQICITCVFKVLYWKCLTIVFILHNYSLWFTIISMYKCRLLSYLVLLLHVVTSQFYINYKMDRFFFKRPRFLYLVCFPPKNPDNYILI